ncbi:putative glycoside hydrolase [Sorangium sp. So ce118]
MHARVPHGLLALAAVVATPPARADLPAPSARIAPDKFIPSFAILYGKAMPGAPTDELARFDVLVTSPGLNHRWASGMLNSWQALKALHPDQLTFLYSMGPTEYNTENWGEFTEGWSWVVINHGLDTADPWIARGMGANVMLQNRNYPYERLMLPGNPRWQTYWAERVYTQTFSTPPPGSAGADGVFADNTTAGNWIIWEDVGTTTVDPPQAYTAADGSARHDLWRSDVLRAIEVGVRSLATHSVGMVPNYGGMGRPERNWDALEEISAPPVMALQEDGFVSPYGPDDVFYSWDYDAKVREFARLRMVRALMTCHGRHMVSPETRDGALAQMSERDARGESGWDALWFSIGSFLLGFDDARGNGYLSFTIWDGGRVVYFDEFDPHRLHLGRARGAFSVSDTGLYVREFDDGWIAVNPTLFTHPQEPVTLTFAVPEDMARVVTHDNLGASASAPLVSSAPVPPGHAIILLKPGHAIDDSDNRPVVNPDAGVDSGVPDAAGDDASDAGVPDTAGDDASDAGVVLDAAGNDVSAGTNDGAAADTGGCGCRTAGQGDSGGPAQRTHSRRALLLAGAVAFAARQRRGRSLRRATGSQLL